MTASALLAASGGGQVSASQPASAAAPEPWPSAPFEFLIGDWDVGPEGAAPGIVLRFKWGPNKSYIWCSASMVEAGGEQPHFEGMLVWNGLRKLLDLLVALGLDGSGAQEQGTMVIDRDGTIVREVTAVSAGGAQRFRETFRRDGDRVITAVMRQTRKGWVPTFPGSGRLIMSRRR